MKHLSIYTLLPAMLLATLLLVAGCNNEFPTEELNPEQGVQLCLNIDGMPAVSAGGTTRAVNENTVKDLWILQFQMNGTSTTDGKLMSKTYIANVANASNIIYRPLPGDNMALYLVANSGNIMDVETGRTLESIKNDYLGVTTSTGSTYPYSNSTHLTMVGQSATKKFILGEKVRVTLTRIMAKIDLTVTNKVTNMLPMQGYPQLTLMSVQLKNAPHAATLRPINATGGNYPDVSYKLFKNYDVAPVTDGISFSSTIYLSPNIRGVNPSVTHESQKNAIKAPTAYATYIEIIGKAKASAHSPEVDVLYRLFPGANNTTNYNIEANTAYTVNIELTGINATDTRMRISTGNFDLMQGGVDDEHQDNITGWNLPKVGYYYYTDGSYSSIVLNGKTINGMIYYVDPKDPRWFKVMAMERPTQVLIWASNNSYKVGATNEADGSINYATIEAAFNNRMAGDTPITEANIEAAFPAAAYCQNYRGKTYSDPIGTWHLPAKNELQYLYCAFNGEAATLWVYGPQDQVSINKTAREKWNNAIVSITGNNVTSYLSPEYHWTSTEFAGAGGDPLRVYLDDTSTIRSDRAPSNYRDTPNVRCVRNIAPPPAVGDYYYTDGTYSKELVSGKTPNGIVFYVDATRFKVMALGQPTSFLWAAKETYVIGNTGINIEDGRINVAAIKKYSKDHINDAAEATKTTGTLLTDFMPAGYCDIYQDSYNSDAIGTWYLPARNELQYLYCAYNGIAPYTWGDYPTQQGPAKNTLAQNSWNARITAAGGPSEPLNNSWYWTSTEYNNSSAVTIAFGEEYGYAYYVSKKEQYRTRCIREIKR